MATSDPPGGDDRGQTPQDFAVGISIFLITVTFVFTFVPSVLQPSMAGEEPTLTVEADRVSSGILSNLSTPGQPNRLDKAKTDAFFGQYKGNVSGFRSAFGIPTYREVNVTIVSLENDKPVTNATGPYTFGDEYDDQQAVVTQRVVKMSHPSCDDGCLLVVRVW